MKRLLIALGLLCLASSAFADPDPYDMDNLSSARGYAYFDTTITVAAGGDSIPFGFWADEVRVTQAVNDSGFVTVKVTSNTASNLSGGIRTGLDRVYSAGVLMFLYRPLSEYAPQGFCEFHGKDSFSGVIVTPYLAAPNKKVCIQAWRGAAR